MVTKKTPTKRASAGSTLKFRKEWIFDPGPEWLRVNRAAVVRLNQLKEEFAKRANEVINKGQI